MADFDVVIGGGSPIMALIALKCAVDFKCRVAVLDAAPVLGGSWTPQTRFGHEIDNGPHLLYNFNSDIQPILAEITRFTGARFQPMQPQPHSNHWIHRSIMEYSFGVTPGSRVQKIGRAALAIARKVMPLVSSPLYYEPGGGLSALATLSAQALETKGVTVFRNAAVSSVHSIQGGAEIRTDKRTFPAALFLSSARLLPHLEPERFSSAQGINRLEYAQAYIVIRANRQMFSYFRPFDDPVIFLAADLSASAVPVLPDDRRILSINLQAGIDYRTIDSDQIHAFLLRNSLIAIGDTIEAVEWEAIENPEIPLDMVQARNSASPHVQFVHCNNKVKAMSEYLLGNRLEKIVRSSQL